MRKILSLIAVITILLIPSIVWSQETTTEWVTRLNAIGEGDWRTARGEVSGLAGLPVGKAYALVRDIYPQLKTKTVREELIGGFLQALHPDGLKVALLGLDDPEMNKSIRSRLAFTVGLPATMKPEQVTAWVKAHQNRTLEQVRQDRVKEIVQSLRKARSDEVAALLEPSQPLWRSKKLREVATREGITDALRPWLIGKETTDKAQRAAVEILQSFDLADNYLKEVVFPLAQDIPSDKKEALSEKIVTRLLALSILGDKHYRPAFPLLKEQLIHDLNLPDTLMRYRAAEILAKFGEPETIPLMIGIIAADNNNAVYWVGYFGLGKLTGVPYFDTHDGTWWKKWWETHKKELPETVRTMTIPDFPHAPDYKEPLPVEATANTTVLRDALFAGYQNSLKQVGGSAFISAGTIAAVGTPADIPRLIGLIASDNNYNTVYGIGYFGLTPLTGVPYNPLHDGNWWRLWWETHKKELPEAVRDLPIPDFPHSPAFHEPIALELHRDPDTLRQRLVNDLKTAVAQYDTPEKFNPFWTAVQELAELNDPRVVPDVIELMPDVVDEQLSKTYYLDYYLLTRLTGVPYVEKRTRGWWRKWWQENKADFEKRYPTEKLPPDFVTLTYKPRTQKQAILVADCPYDPEVFPASSSNAEDANENPKDIADVPSVRHFAGGDKDKYYRLVGYDPKSAVPLGGYSLLVILPGGDGSDNFRWFIRRIKKNALPKEMLVAQLIAPQWSEWQAENLVWPTRKNPFFGMKFSTEEFIEAVIQDVGKQMAINPKQVYTMAWSSSGPAVYTHLATKGASVAGAFIAMSVFRPNELPDPAVLAEKRVSLLHSPQDFIKIQQARDGEAFLKAHGAAVRFEEYEGGHGWRGDVFGNIEHAVTFLLKP